MSFESSLNRLSSLCMIPICVTLYWYGLNYIVQISVTMTLTVSEGIKHKLLLALQSTDYNINNRCASCSMTVHFFQSLSVIDHCIPLRQNVCLCCLLVSSDESLWHFIKMNKWKMELANKLENAAQKQKIARLEAKF